MPKTWVQKSVCNGYVIAYGDVRLRFDSMDDALFFFWLEDRLRD